MKRDFHIKCSTIILCLGVVTVRTMNDEQKHESVLKEKCSSSKKEDL